MSLPAPEPLAVGVGEAARLLRVSRDTFREKIQPDLKIVRLGGCKRVAIAELERWLDGMDRRSVHEREDHGPGLGS